MINPDDVRAALSGMGEAEIRRQIAAGQLGGEAATIATRWLAAREDESAASEARNAAKLRRDVRTALLMSTLAAGASILTCALTLSRHH